MLLLTCFTWLVSPDVLCLVRCAPSALRVWCALRGLLWYVFRLVCFAWIVLTAFVFLRGLRCLFCFEYCAWYGVRCLVCVAECPVLGVFFT